MGYIYKITNTVNDKIYVGQTTRTIEKRFQEHIKNSKFKKTKLYNAMNKYGIENFSIEQLEECNNRDLDNREIYWISFYNSYENGYNSTLGGEGTKVFDDKKIQQIVNLYNDGYCIRDIKKILNSTIETISYYLKQELKLTDEEIKQKGYQIRSERRNKSVLQFDLEGNYIASYSSYKEAQEKTGAWYTHIGAVCNGKRATAGGYIWKRP